MASAVYPEGGWRRAFWYVQRRLQRLPDTPEKIGRGIWAGVFTTFTPFYGLHFVVAAMIAKLMRGNILAALMATFFGNPLTYLPIAAASLGVGHWVLGRGPHEDIGSVGGKFASAGRELAQNIWALFTPGRADWHGLSIFYHDIFFPYLIGGLLPGVVCATVAYFLAVPVLRVQQNRRRKVLRAKLEKLSPVPRGDGEGPKAD
ncbi:DUF2062 domain-containing protein [Loktanella sp. SALINAS62]|uniref:DUF2062 domain-containing protein n=1 Tax=Loktanella sp. SALINAS62 TaxID=2706124 RepID=UPI001B8BC8D9|nr:DUF2062 domain-containing protein [Loktanella sp. SALINAS62]MBS1302211.1 DUF2062 domain-containing protein [Loktanella sp. SALINAS62]